MNSRLIAVLFLAFCLSACNRYWRERGQAPGVQQLVDRAQGRLQENVEADKYSRATFRPLAVGLEQSLISSYSAAKNKVSNKELAKLFEETVSNFNKLEGKISVTSRAAYSELHSQARAFRNSAKKGQEVPAKAYGMFAARALFFLANEMEVPAPSFGA